MEQDVIARINQVEEKINVLNRGFDLSQKEVLTFAEAARYSGISKSYLYKLTSTNQIPFSKPSGKLVFFRRTDLEAWLLKNRVCTKTENAEAAADYCLTH